MRYFGLFVALLLSSNVNAATYVYQANAYQGHQGRCGGELLPFKVTITVRKALPPNTTLNNERFQTISINAGGKYQWGERYTKKHEIGGFFVTDSNGGITEWSVGAAESARTQFYTHNETGSVVDLVEFKCGSAGTENDPGAWTRTE